MAHWVRSADGLMGKTRIDSPETGERVILNTDGLLEVNAWRKQYYKQPFCDELNGYYRVSPPTRGAVKAYIGLSSKRMHGVELNDDLFAQYKTDPESLAVDTRQTVHKLESLELATAVFWAISQLRKSVLLEASATIADRKTMDESVARYTADAIMDLGICLLEPFERNWHLAENRRAYKSPQGIKDRLDKIAPDLGANVLAFGGMCLERPEELTSYDGVVAINVALDEQDTRIDTWSALHGVVTDTFPNLPVSNEILYLHAPMDELLSLEPRLAA